MTWCARDRHQFWIGDVLQCSAFKAMEWNNFDVCSIGPAISSLFTAASVLLTYLCKWILDWKYLIRSPNDDIDNNETPLTPLVIVGRKICCKLQHSNSTMPCCDCESVEPHALPKGLNILQFSERTERRGDGATATLAQQARAEEAMQFSSSTRYLSRMCNGL